MTEEQMNIAIAESRGWTDMPIINGKYGQTDLPDYTNDLNAMHELEKSIKEPASYAGWLEAVTESEIAVGSLDPREIEGRVIRYRSLFWTAHATARQRAEAYLRTIGRFEDE
jgi:hypothetical protein